MRERMFAFLCLAFIFSFLSNASFAQAQIELTLDNCVKMAIEKNEEILKKKQALEEVKGALTAVRSDEYLQMNFTSWYERSKKDNKFETKDYNGTLRVEQLLMRFGALPKKLDEVQEQYRRAALDLQSARINIVSQTRRTFYDIILIRDEINERKLLRDEIEKKRARTAERVQQKIALELDLLGVELELAQQELRINELKRELRIKKVELLQIIGFDEGADFTLSGELPDTEFILEDCIKIALANRVELKDYKGLIERQERIVSEVYWELLPELRAKYRYKDTAMILTQEDKTWDTSISYENPIWEKKTPERNKWEFSFGLSFPIFDGFRLKGIMQEEKARLEKLKLEAIQKEKQIRWEIRSAYEDVANKKENMDVQEKVVTVRRKTLESMEAIVETPIISQKYPRLAGITFDDVIRAREQYTEDQKSYFAKKQDYMMARENLLQKMGFVE